MANQLDEYLARLPEKHRLALRWFSERVGTEQPWPQPLQTPWSETLLATKAKGIYKPSWSPYALSVRQTLDSPYPDKPPRYRPDGTWLYEYFQENGDSNSRDEEFTNRALLACWRDSVPVGVMRQARRKPRARYQVLGLALVAGWEGGYFFLEGAAPSGLIRNRGPAGEIEAFFAEEFDHIRATGGLDPEDVIDGRRRIIAQIIRRQGQPEFRQKLLYAYGYCCAISNCNVVATLEAAHIVPFHKMGTNHVRNGLLLRADLHVLFDLGLISVHEDNNSVLLAAALQGTSYAHLLGKQVRLPDDTSCRPSLEALRYHRSWAGL